MIPTIVEAINYLRPNSKWGINASNELYWDDSNTDSKPTKEELDIILHQLINNYPMYLLRIERNKRLACCDYVIIKYLSQNKPIPVIWTAYMQSLRDLPLTSVPQIDSFGNLDMSSVIWPISPC